MNRETLRPRVETSSWDRSRTGRHPTDTVSTPLDTRPTAAPQAQVPSLGLPDAASFDPWPSLDIEEEPDIPDAAVLARQAAHLRELEREQRGDV
jgi:hypothetical protein